MRRTSICSARTGTSVSPTRHSDTTASTPSGSDRSADVAEPDTLVVGMPGGYTQFVTAVAEVKPSDVLLRVIAAASSMRSRVRIPGQPCNMRRLSAGTADAPYAAPSSPPAMAAMVSVSPPPRTAASSAWRRWSTRRILCRITLRDRRGRDRRPRRLQRFHHPPVVSEVRGL